MLRESWALLKMLQCCLCPSAACCDLHAVLCQSPCNAAGLRVGTNLEQQCDAVMTQCLYVSAVLHNAAVLLVSICCMLCLACCALSVILQCSGPGFVTSLEQQ